MVRHHPIFIVGMPRSGTTLLSTLLSAHPSISILPETHLLTRWLPRRWRRREVSRTDLKAFWGEENETIWAQHSPILFHEFRDTAFAIRDGNRVVAYLLGFISQVEPVGYVHLIAVREGHRRRGNARALYEHFEEAARARGCTGLKAVVMPWNDASVEFHLSVGLEPVGMPDVEGKRVVKDYRGPGKDRVVLQKRWG